MNPKQQSNMLPKKKKLGAGAEQNGNVMPYFDGMVEYISEALIATDNQYVVIGWNTAAERIYGWKAEEVMGNMLNDFLQTEYRDTQRDHVISKVNETGTWSGEVTQLRKDGKRIPIRSSVSAVKDEQGTPVGFIGINRDISDQKQVEETLSRSEAKFHFLFDSVPQGIVHQDANGRVIDANPAAQKILGLTLDQLQGRTSFDQRWKSIHEDGSEFPGETHPAMLALQTGKNVRDVVMGVYNPVTDEYRWLNINVIPRFQAGEKNPYEAYAIFEDITEHKQVEERLQVNERTLKLFVEYAPAAIAMFDRDMKYIAASRRFLADYNLKDENIIGRSHYEIFPEISERWKEIHRRCLAGATEKEEEDPFPRVDGTLDWVRWEIHPWHDKPGEIGGIILFSEVVTERKRVEATLQEGERTLKLFVEYAPAAIAMFDRDMKYIAASRRFFADYNLKDENIIGRSHYEVFPEISERVKEVHKRCLAGATEKKEEDSFPRADGTLDWVRWEVHPWYDRSGEIGGIILFSEVITERKLAEREIKQRTEDLLLINALNDAVNRGEDIEGIAEVFARETRNAFACQDAAIYLLSPDGKYIEMQSATLSRKVTERIEKLIGRPIPRVRIPIKEGGYFKKILSNEQGVIISDPKVIQQWIAEFAETTFLPAAFRVVVRKTAPQIYKSLNLQSTISIPLISSGQAIGILDMSSKGQFTEEDLRRVHSISHQVTAVLLRKQAEKQVQLQLRRMSALGEIDRAISSSLDMRLSLDIVLSQVLSQLNVDAASILLLNPFSQMLEYVAGKGYRTQNIRQSRMRLGEGLAGRAGLERKVLHVPSLSVMDSQFQRRELLKDEQFVEYFGVPLIAKGLLKGVLEIFHRTPLDPDIEWINYLETLGGQAAIAIDNVQLFENIQQSNLELVAAYDATIEGWSRAMDLRDKETEGHTKRVTETTVQLAKKMGINQPEMVHLRRGALLHDIGKLGVPDNILLKPDALTRIEWAVMRQHPSYAFNMLMSINYLRPALDIPYCHHEKWDGSGYPRALSGEQIPLAARIFAIVDVWDALRSDRPYRAGWPLEKTYEYIREQSGKHFDPQVVAAFLSLLDELPDLK